MADQASPSAARWLERFFVSVGLGLVTGWFSVGLVSLILGFPRAPEGEFPLVFGVGQRGGSLMLIVCWAAAGMFAGARTPIMPVPFGLATLALFPVLATIEMVLNPYTHTLWPFEFVMYGVLSGIPIGSAYIGRCLRRKPGATR